MLFKKSSQKNEPQAPQKHWKVLIVDDEQEVHNVTKFALSGFRYKNSPVEFLSAYSGQEATGIVSEHKDIAVILLDVVMEEEDSGFRVVEYIRNELQNHFVRIILRTGQPGAAPEEEAITAYDINDYKDKTELTDKKLFTTITAALRSYSDIMTIETLRESLEQKVEERTKELRELNANLQKRVDEEIEKAHKSEQLLIQQSKMAAMGELLSVISHQWKQPLTVLNLVADTLRQDIELDGEEIDRDSIYKATGKIIEQINFMDETIEEFRTFLKPSKKKCHFPLLRSIRQVVQIIGSVIEKNGITLDISYSNCSEDEDIVVYGYEGELKHVFLNIITNAKDAIIAKQIGDGKEFIKITITKEENNAAISIADSGGGIQEEVLERVFENYYTTKGQKGTGIGLYMAKTIIESNMGGSLSVQNLPGGAEFTIKLNTQ